MAQKKIDIIMFNMSSFSEWERGAVNRNFHVLQNLLKDPRVGKIMAVDFLPFSLKRAARNYWENIIRGPKGTVVCHDLTARCVQAGPKLFVYSSIDSVFSSGLTLKKISKTARKLGFENIVTWSFFPMFADCFADNNGLGAKLTVFDTVDNWAEHPSFVKHKEALKRNYRLIAQKADLIFSVSENLLGFYWQMGRTEDIYWIPNGIDIAHFQGTQEHGKQCHKLLKGVKRPIVGYVGIIQSRIDMELVRYLAEKNPDKSFVFVGPVWPNIGKEILEGLSNVHFPGPVPYAEAPRCLREFDVCVIPHVIDEFTRSMNPLKLYEYLACGKPVVTTPVAGIESFGDLVYVAEDYGQFSQKISQALEEDDETLAKKRQEAVRDHSWDKRTKEMLSLIFSKLNQKLGKRL